MQRREVLGYGGILAAGLSGCSSLGTGQPSGGVTIEYSGDRDPGQVRTIALLVGTYDRKEKLDSGTDPPAWDSDVAFQALYRLSPERTLDLDIDLDEGGEYRMDLWVQELGTIGSAVTVTDTGRLRENHRFEITAEGLSHG